MAVTALVNSSYLFTWLAQAWEGDGERLHSPLGFPSRIPGALRNVVPWSQQERVEGSAQTLPLCSENPPNAPPP